MNVTPEHADLYNVKWPPKNRISRRTFFLRSATALSASSLLFGAWNVMLYRRKIEHIRRRCLAALRHAISYRAYAPPPEQWMTTYVAFLNENAAYRDCTDPGGWNFFLGGDLGPAWVEQENGECILLGRCGSFAADFLIKAAGSGAFNSVQMDLVFSPRSKGSCPFTGHFNGTAGCGDERWMLTFENDAFSHSHILQKNLAATMEDYRFRYMCFHEEVPEEPPRKTRARIA